MSRNNFDALRLLMALIVVWSHCFGLYFGSEDHEPVSILLSGIHSGGTIAVLVFFVISGFLICHSFVRSRSIPKFLLRRVARIHPAYLVATSICAFVVVPLYSSRSIADYSFSEAVRLIGGNVLLQNSMPTSDVFVGNPSSAINGSLWSIPFEFWCYIGVIALGVSRALTLRGACAAAIVALMATKIWLDLTGRKPGGGIVGDVIGWPYMWFTVAPCFLLGLVVYLYRDAVPRRLSILICSTLATVASAHLPVDPWLRQIILNTLLPPTLAYATFYFAFHDRIRLHHAARWGDFSYGTYLYAFPLQQMLMASIGFRLSFHLYVALSLLLSLAAGIVSWNLVERWFLPKTRQRRDPPTVQGSSLAAELNRRA